MEEKLERKIKFYFNFLHIHVILLSAGGFVKSGCQQISAENFFPHESFPDFQIDRS